MPFTGVDALEAANAILSALYEWRKGLAGRVSATPQIGSPQLTVGLIKGGINTNVVPDRVVFRLDRRIIPSQPRRRSRRNFAKLSRPRAAHIRR